MTSIDLDKYSGIMILAVVLFIGIFLYGDISDGRFIEKDNNEDLQAKFAILSAAKN